MLARRENEQVTHARDDSPRPRVASPPGVAQLLALQRSAGNAAVQRAILQRYQFHVIKENRELAYTDEYNPDGKPNLTHLRGPRSGKDAVYESNEDHGATYGLKHAKEHKQLINLAQEIIDVLIRRADMAINSGHEAYMIGVMERAEKASGETDKISQVSAATSGDHPQAFTDTLQAIAQFHAEIKLDAVAAIPPMEVVRAAVPEAELTGGKVKDSDQVDQSKQTLKACAAKKLTFAVRPPAEVNMTEVLYDPLGTSPVRIPDNETGIRYHHRQRVPSCEDCMKNLPHVHRAVVERLDVVKRELEKHLGSAPQPTAEPSGSKPLKSPAAVKPKGPQPWEPVPIAPDKQLGEWARTAVDDMAPRVAQDTLTSRKRDLEALKKKQDKPSPEDEEQLKRLDAETKEIEALQQQLVALRADVEKVRGGLTNVVGPLRTLLLDDFRVRNTWPVGKPIPRELTEDVTRELDQRADPLLATLEPLGVKLTELAVSPYMDPVQLAWGIKSVKTGLARVRPEVEGGADRKYLEQWLQKLQAKAAADARPKLKGGLTPEAFIAAHAAWKAVPECNLSVDLEIQPDGGTILGKAFEKSLPHQIKEEGPRELVKAGIMAIVKEMVWERPAAKPVTIKVRFEKKKA